MNKKLKKAMISSGAYIVLMSILLIGVSTAKYTQATVAYSSFGAADYNVVLLGQDPDTGSYIAGDGSPQQFGRTLLSGDMTPGMVYSSDAEVNTAKVFPFSVGNGTCPEDVSEIAQDYTITLRTTKNLPLNYKLMLGATVFNASEAKALDKYGHVITDIETAEMDENGIAWYEWSFKDIGNTGEGTVEVETSPVFSLPGGVVRSNLHAIVVEWPIEKDDGGVTTDNSVDYMKEIELLEVRVASAQKNNTSEVQTILIDPTDTRLYSRGIILLDDDVENLEQIEYNVDYRAFQSTEEGLSYEFTVENGVGKTTDPITGEVSYTVSMMVPLLYQIHSSGTGTLNYEYELQVKDRTNGLWVTLDPIGGEDGLGNHEFKINEYDPEGERVDITSKKTDNVEEYNNDLCSCSESDSDYRIMKQLHFGMDDAGYQNVYHFENTVSEEGNERQQEKDEFRILIKNVNGNIPAYVQLLGRIIVQVDVIR